MAELGKKIEESAEAVRQSRLAEMLVTSTLGGMSRRKVANWACHLSRRSAHESDMAHRFWQGIQASLTFLKSGLRTWS